MKTSLYVLLIINLLLIGCKSDQRFSDNSRVYGEPTARPIPNEIIVQHERVDPRDSVDVLFVVDDSCSMYDDQQKLAKHLPTLGDKFRRLQLNWRIAFTTTSGWYDDFPLRELPSNKGIIYWIDPDTRDKTSLFVYGATPGTRGAGPESGFAAAYHVFSGHSQTYGFFRKNSSFHIIAISDEPDQSNWSYYPEIEAPGKFVKKMRKFRELSSFSIITDPHSTYTHGNPGAYEAAARRSDGHVIDLDGDNWDAFFEEFADNIETDPTIDFYLTHIPADYTQIHIRVCEDVDEDDYCEHQSTEEDLNFIYKYYKPNWTYEYDPYRNSIRLISPERELEDYDYVTITYEIPTGSPQYN